MNEPVCTNYAELFILVLEKSYFDTSECLLSFAERLNHQTYGC